MAFKYSVTRNHLNKSAQKYVARPQQIIYRTLDQVIAQMTREGSILKDTECYAVLGAFFQQLARNLAEGEGLKCAYLQITPGIQGVFENEEDQFDSKRHQVVINAVVGDFLKKSAKEIQPQKVKANQAYRPIIEEVYDIGTNTTNDQLTPGHMAEIKGDKLKINPENEDEGVFLVHTKSKQETKVSNIRHNFPKSLQWVVPTTLAFGKYSLEVRNRPYRTKALRKGGCAHLLSVVT